MCWFRPALTMAGQEHLGTLGVFGLSWRLFIPGSQNWPAQNETSEQAQQGKASLEYIHILSLLRGYDSPVHDVWLSSYFSRPGRPRGGGYLYPLS